jgi:tRNA(Ile)-lysidine synthase
VLVALSGGADSVALLDALCQLSSRDRFRVAAAHLDHGLRPDAAADAAFCEELCRSLGIPLTVGGADVRARARSERGGLEQAARAERYAFLRRVRSETGAAVIAVAHTRDDQAETLLLRLLRGAGRAGLAGMRAASGDVIRPLLGVSREDVLAHLRARGLEWREDPSNRDFAHARNRVRHELLPYLERHFNPRIRETLARCAGVLADEARLLDSLAAPLADGASARGEAALSLELLNEAPLPVARLAVRRMLSRAGGLRAVSERHVDRILSVARSARPSGRRLSLPGGREASFAFGRLRVAARVEPAAPFALPLAVPGRVELPSGAAVVARPSAGPAVSGAHAAVVAAPESPLVVRTRRPGDRVRSNGRDVSLKRFLMARHVPALERGGLPVVAAGDRVVWVPGQPLEATLEAGRFVRLELVPAPGRAAPAASDSRSFRHRGIHADPSPRVPK